MKEEDKLLNSSYDGIQEYDNDLPKWWVYLFYATVIFSIGYWGYYHTFKMGPSQEELVLSQIEEAKKAKEEEKAASPKVELASLVTNQEVLTRGKEVFAARCAACHGQLGEGLIGPNLTDDSWIHGGSLENIRLITQKGVIEKGMLPWEGVIPDSEIDAVTAYIWSLYGTNPPNAKAAQGERYNREGKG